MFNKDQKVLPTYYPANLVRWLLESGLKEENLFHNTDIDKSTFSEESSRISFNQLRQLILNAMAETKDVHLGVKFGEQLSLTSMGMVGYAALASNTLGDAIRTISRYVYLRDPLINAELTVDKNVAKLRFEEPMDYGDIRHFMYMTIFSSFNEIFHFLLDTQQRLTGKLSYPSPKSDIIQFKESSIVLEFDSEHTQILIPISCLETALKTADPMTASAAKEICETQLKLNKPIASIANQVRQYILKNSDSFPQLEEVAIELCMSPRTLRRKLMLSGTSYQSIIDEIRYQLAKKYLVSTQLKVADISYQLGFNDPSNFGRAFKKWSGVSPTSFRTESIQLNT